MNQLYVIESRYSDGKLDLAEPQPEKFFGNRAITGITSDQIAKAIFSVYPQVILSGTDIHNWPRKIHPQFVARKKTWQ